MKTIFLLILILTSSLGFAADRKAVGIMLGSPTGASGKYWLDRERAVDAGVGFSLGSGTPFTIHSDYLLHRPDSLYFNDVHALDLYYGLGARMKFADDIDLGVRVPVGLVHDLNGGQAEVFGELVPIVDLFSRFGVDLAAAFGARYYF
jgi:hypothetical protein